MAFESIKAEIDLLLAEMVDQPRDAHEMREQIREKLNELRAMGLPLPADLVAVEKALAHDLDQPEDNDPAQQGS